MSEIQLVHFSFGGESPDRSRMHETALRDARVATDHRDAVQAPTGRDATARVGLVSRLRLAFSGGPAVTEPCNCPA